MGEDDDQLDDPWAVREPRWDTLEPPILVFEEDLILSDRSPSPRVTVRSLDVQIGTDRATGSAVCLPHAVRVRAAALIGQQGSGKSSLLERLILADLEHRIPAFVIDPHGLLADRVMKLARPEDARRIVLIEASRTAPLGLNLLECREPVDDDDDPEGWAVESVIATIKKLYGKQDQYLPRLERYLRLAAQTLIPSGLTLLDALNLFDDDKFRQACLSRVRDESMRHDLRRRWAFYERLRPADRAEHTESVMNRLDDLFTATPAIRGMVGSRHTTIPFDHVLKGDGLLLVSLPSERLTPERCNFVGAMLLCALADRVFVRNVLGTTPRLHLYLDEYHRFATSTTAELITQGRKYGVGMTVAHQNLDQIEDSKVRGAVRGVGTLVLLRLSGPDADELAGELPITPREEWIERIPEPDGDEPVMVPTRTPIEHLLTKGHQNPLVSSAARTLFHSPKVDDYDDRNRSLYKAVEDVLIAEMLGEEHAPGHIIVKKLTSIALLLSHSYLAPKFQRSSSSSRKYIEPWQLWPEGISELVERAFRTPIAWLIPVADEPHMSDRVLQIMRENVTTALRDEIYPAVEEIDRKDLGPCRWIVPEVSEWAVNEVVRQIHLIAMLCKGLAVDPILVPSGQYRPRMTTRLIVHPAQTYQDARNVLAGRLVNPPEQEPYLAHVRLPDAYHQVRLARPPSGSENGQQVDEIRVRSRAQYGVRPTERRHGPEEPPPIGRRSPDSP